MLLSSAFAHDFSVCDSRKLITINSINLTPTQPEVGHNLLINVSGNAQTSLDNNTIVDVGISALGIKILDQKFNLCDYTQCPVVPGDFTLAINQDIPSAAPANIGINAKIKVVSGSDTFACVSLDTKVVKPTESEHILELFQHWKKQHQKQYHTNEHYQRWHNFRHNFEKIQQFNDENKDIRLAMNQFGDMSHEEYRGFLSSQIPKSKSTHSRHFRLGVTLPDSVDWVAENKVSAVKNQGSCGSCWAFSTTGSIETAYAIAFNQMKTFSEQELVDCSTSYGNNGCNGGLMDSGFDYVKDNGLSTEDDYPYQGTDGTCQKDKFSRAVHVTGFTDVKANDELALKEAVSKTAVSVAIEADKLAFQFYHSGVLKKGKCGTNLDHGVLLVGYGTADDGTMYWKVKNSWGESWGQSGYVLLERTEDRNSEGTCGIATTASYPSVSQGYVEVADQ